MPDNDLNELDLISIYDQTSTLDELLDGERYTHEKFIAEGAIKRVYKVKDTYCEREVALARIKPEVLNWQHGLEFIREVQLTSGFEHPHIIRVYDLGITNNSPWFTMELTSGLTLHNWSHLKRRSLNHKLSIISNICDAVQYAHERDVLHLDLKPDNISIGIHGQILIVDWGIATSVVKRAAEYPEGDHTIHAHIKGTPGYMAPEQTRENVKASPQTDIFAIGAILYYLLTGLPPIVGYTSDERLANTEQLKLRSCDHLSIPPRLAPILKKCLSERPEDRYTSVLELSEDIELFRDGFASQAESAPLTTLLSLFIQRHKKRCIAALALLLAAVAANSIYISKIRLSESRTESERLKAISLLEEIQSKDNTLKQQQLDYAQDLLAKAKVHQYRSQINAAYNAINTAYQHDPNDPKIRLKLGLLCFMTQRFKEAHELLSASAITPKLQIIADLAAEHAGLSPSESSQRIPETFELLCKKSRHPYATYFFINNSHRFAKSKHVDLIKILIANDNRISNLHFDWNHKTRVLNLSNNPALRTLTVKETLYAPAYHMLHRLPVKSLILDDTPYNRTQIENYRPNKKCEVIFIK